MSDATTRDEAARRGNGVRARKSRDRSGTEAELLAAARRLFARNGVLAGLNLHEVAEEAGVNRGLIYQYFGSRRALLRAALADKTAPRVRITLQERQMPFLARRLAVWKRALKSEDFIKLETLLALDGDEHFQVFPLLELTRQDLQRDVERGVFSDNDDVMVSHVMSTAAYLGYCIFRETFSRDTGIPVKELDRRATDVYIRMVSALTGQPDARGEDGPSVKEAANGSAAPKRRRGTRKTGNA